MSELQKRLRASADEVAAFPHPSHCDHLHDASAVMREAADALDALIEETSTQAQEIARLTQELDAIAVTSKACARACDKLGEETVALRAELAQTQRDRQSEHDLRVQLAGEVETLRARAEAAEKDAARYRWLTQDHDDPWVRQHCRELIGRMGTMSYSATSMAIDAALEIDAARGGA